MHPLYMAFRLVTAVDELAFGSVTITGWVEYEIESELKRTNLTFQGIVDLVSQLVERSPL